MTAVYVILTVLAVIMLIMLIPADLTIRLSYNDKSFDNAIGIQYAFIKIKLYPADKEREKTKKEKKVKNEKEKDNKKKNSGGASVIRLAREAYRELKDDIKKLGGYFFKRVIRIKELNISAKFGTGSPMYTGIASGTAHSAVYNAVAFIDRHMTLDKWKVSFDADFDNACLDAGIYIKIRTRILFALRLGAMAGLLLLKLQKINRRLKQDG